MRRRFSLAALALGLAACAPARCPEPAAATKAMDPAPSAAIGAPPSPPPAALAPLERAVDAGPLRLRFDATPLGNLVHQLDCLAEQMHCSRAAFEALWKDSLGWDAEDARAVVEWKALRERYQGRINSKDAGESPVLPLPRADAFDIAQRTRLSGFVATTAEEHVKYLTHLGTPADAARVEAILARFRPRFARFWSEKGEPLARAYVEGFAKLCVTKGVVDEIAGALRFYAASLPAGTILHFHVVARPAHESTNASLQLGPHAEIEALEGEKPEDRVAVVVHELYHFFYASAPWADLRALSARFVEPGDPLAILGFSAMNEVLATALGSARVDRLVRPERHAKDLALPLGLYADPTVDRITKAFLPALDARIARKGTLFEKTFVDEYLAAVRSAHPKGARLAHYLRPLLSTHERSLEKAADALDPDVRAWQFGGLVSAEIDGPDVQSFFTGRAAWPAAFFVTPKGLPKLTRFAGFLGPDTIATIEREAKKSSPFAHVSLGRAGSLRVVFVASDAAAMERLVRDLLSRENPSAGILRPTP
jgi:hypothetical protein